MGNTSCIHDRKALHLHLIMWEHIPQSHQHGSALTSDHLIMWEHIPQSHQNGSWTHHLPLEGTSIWRTPSFSPKYSNFTMAILNIEWHQGWLHPRITCDLRQDRLHPRKTYRKILRLSHLRASPGFYAQTTCLTDYASTPSFDRSQSGSHTGASLLLSTSYKNSIQINQIK